MIDDRLATMLAPYRRFRPAVYHGYGSSLSGSECVKVFAASTRYIGCFVNAFDPSWMSFPKIRFLNQLQILFLWEPVSRETIDFRGND